MTAAPGLYLPGAGWLYRLDPRPKLWFALLAVVLAIIVGRLEVLAGLLVATQAVLLAGGVPPGRLLGVWARLAPLVLVILILQPLLAPGDGLALVQAGPVRVTTSGLLTGLRYGLRISAAAFAVLIPILTTPASTLVRGFQKVGLPYTWAMTIGLALRYLSTVGELYATISEAQQARGLDLSSGGLAKRARGAVPTLVALIVATLRLSDSLALGLAARGFGLAARRGTPRTTLHEITLRRADWLALTVTTAAFVVVLLAAAIRW